MPWILISKYSSLYLTPPPLCVSHAWLDWEAEISTWITTQPRKLFRQVIHTSCWGFLSKVVVFFSLLYLLQHILYRHMHTFCVKQVSAGQKKAAIWRSCSASLRLCGVLQAPRVQVYGVDKALVLAGAFALTPHQRHSQLPHCIIAKPLGQWKGPL